jgi:hypothetical protein
VSVELDIVPISNQIAVEDIIVVLGNVKMAVN